MKPDLSAHLLKLQEHVLHAATAAAAGDRHKTLAHVAMCRDICAYIPLAGQPGITATLAALRATDPVRQS